jgi:hypothetical protein
VQQQESPDRTRPHLLAARPPLEQATYARRSEHPVADPRRKSSGDLGDARLHEFRDSEVLVRRRANLLSHAREARRTRFEIGYADRVLEAHPQRQATRGRLRERPRTMRPYSRIECSDALHSRQIKVHVGHVLIIEHSARALEHEPLQRRREPTHAIEIRLEFGRSRLRRHLLQLLRARCC